MTNGDAGTSMTRLTSVWNTSPIPVGKFSQFAMICGACNPVTHPRFSDPSETHVPATNTTAKMPTDGVTARTNRRSRLCSASRWFAQTHTKNGNATAAVGLISIPTVTSTIATACRRSSAASTPMVRKASMSRSLCGPPTRWITVIGLATASHIVTGSLPPRCRTSRGSAHAMPASPSNSTTRVTITPAMTLLPVTATMFLATSRNNGP